jgi:hypothetical protein
MPEVTSADVASDAGTLLRTKHLDNSHLPLVHRVAASCLTQYEPKQDVTDAMQAYLDLGSLITEFERRAVALLERVVAPIAPPKP